MPTPIDKQRKNHPLYKTWCHIKQRCGNPSDKAYKDYGGRGIGYPENWKTFEGFYEDMGRDWKAGLSIDRIDNEGSYSKENCRWATRVVQNNNTRRNRYITFNGITKTLAQWSAYTGLKQSTIRQRIDAYGWSIEKALNVNKKEGYQIASYR